MKDAFVSAEFSMPAGEQVLTGQAERQAGDGAADANVGPAVSREVNAVQP